MGGFACDLALPAALSVETLQQPVGNHSGIDISTDSEFHGLIGYALPWRVSIMP